MLSLDVIKRQQLKIDHDYEDDIIQMYLDVAELTVMGALSTDTKPLDKRFDFAVMLLVAHYYENRSETTEAVLKDIPYGVLSLIQQLRGTYNG